MDQVKIFEAFLNAIDIGALFESVSRYRTRDWEMETAEVIKHLIRGKGYHAITPPQISQKLAENGSETLVIDLREEKEYQKGHIKGSLSRPFDDFLRDVVRDEKYSNDLKREIILVCDTGSLSKVVAAIMAEDEGFKKVYSLNGGMRRWNRWLKLVESDFMKNFRLNTLQCCIQRT